MNKRTKIIGLLASIALIGIAVVFCKTGGGDGEESTICTWEPKEVEVKKRQPKHARVFIDASASMADYFGNIDIQNIADALNQVAQVPQKKSVEYFRWGDMSNPIIQSTLIQTLINKDLKGQSTAFDKILGPMAEMASNDTLSILVTDGILSSSSANTKMSSTFTDLDKGRIIVDIQSALEGTNKAISIYRIMGNYDGRYYNKANQKITYQGARPFFVLVMGSPETVRYFDMKAKEGKILKVYTKAEALHIGTAPDMEILLEPADGEPTMAELKDFNQTDCYSYDYNGQMGYRLSFQIPKWIQSEYSDKTIIEMSEILKDGKMVKVENLNIDGSTLSFDIPEAQANKYLTEGNPYKITYKLIDPASKAWDKFSTDDDSVPDDTHTYLLSDFIEAMRLGINGDDNTLLESTLEITPQ